MNPFPHQYDAGAAGGPAGPVRVSAAGRPDLDTDAPPEFGGPEGYWSPEHLFVASIADCFILSFRAVARASRLEWAELSCAVEATLERVDKVTRFTAVTLRPVLRLHAGQETDRAERCLNKAKEVCLITNSLNAEVTLQPSVKASDERLSASAG